MPEGRVQAKSQAQRGTQADFTSRQQILASRMDGTRHSPGKPTDPSRQPIWLPIVEQALIAARAKHAILMIDDDSQSGGPAVVGAGLSDNDLQRFRTPEFLQWMASYECGLRDGQATTWSQIVSDRDFEKSPLYNEIVRPAGGFYAITTKHSVAPLSYFLALCRPRRCGDYSLQDISEFSRQRACITAMFDMDRRLRLAEARSQQLAGLLDSINTAVVLLGAQTWPILANRAAEVLLCKEELTIGSSGLTTQDSTATAKLRYLVATETPGFLDVDRGDERSPLRLFVTPCRQAIAESMTGGDQAPAALVMVSDPECRYQSQTRDRLQAVFGLTYAEAALAEALLHGDTLQSYGIRRGRSENTLKTHLRSVFLKTGTTRQADLMGELAGACFFRF